MSERKIEVEFKTNASDYRRVLFWYQWKRLLLIAIAWLVIFFPILYIVGFGAGANPFDSKNNAPLLVFVLLLLLPLMLGVSIYFGIWRQAGKIERIAEHVRMTFSEDGIQSVAESSSSQRIWEGFAKVYETKADFIFFPQENVFYTIPRRFFTNDAQIKELKSLLRAKLGNKAKLKS